MKQEDRGASCGPGSREPDPAVPALTGFDPSRCRNCNGEGWVCENHPDQAWEGGDAKCCGGAGAPCAVCNMDMAFAGRRWATLEYAASLAELEARARQGHEGAAAKAGRKGEARDFQSMAIAGFQIAASIRAAALRDSDGPRMAETVSQARGEAGPARAEGIAKDGGDHA